MMFLKKVMKMAKNLKTALIIQEKTLIYQA